MERITLNVQKREKTGKGAARSLRKSGSIPAVVYRGGESSPIQLDEREMLRFMKKISGEQVVVNLAFSEGGNSALALMKDYQLDPVRSELLHVDFMEISLSEKITLTVPIATVGEPIGVKRDKGILQHITREVEIVCLPDNVPGHIEIDISGLETAHSVHVSDLATPEGVEILTAPTNVIVTVVPPVVEEAPAEEAAEAEAPEVIKKGKKEETEEEAKKEEG